MSLCKEAACQEAIANLLIYLSSAKSFWYTLNTSHEHGFHLANRFGMSHDNYIALLVAADLARYTNGMLYIKRTQWERLWMKQKIMVSLNTQEFTLP